MSNGIFKFVQINMKHLLYCLGVSMIPCEKYKMLFQGICFIKDTQGRSDVYLTEFPRPKLIKSLTIVGSCNTKQALFIAFQSG